MKNRNKLFVLILLVFFVCACPINIRSIAPNAVDSGIEFLGYKIAEKDPNKIDEYTAYCDAIINASDKDVNILFSNAIKYILKKYNTDAYTTILIKNCIKDLNISLDPESEQVVVLHVEFIQNSVELFKQGLNYNRE